MNWMFSYGDQVMLLVAAFSSKFHNSLMDFPTWSVRCGAPRLDFGQSLVESIFGGGKFVTFKTDKVWMSPRHPAEFIFLRRLVGIRPRRIFRLKPYFIQLKWLMSPSKRTKGCEGCVVKTTTAEVNNYLEMKFYQFSITQEKRDSHKKDLLSNFTQKPSWTQSCSGTAAKSMNKPLWGVPQLPALPHVEWSWLCLSVSAFLSCLWVMAAQKVIFFSTSCRSLDGKQGIWFSKRAAFFPMQSRHSLSKE